MNLALIQIPEADSRLKPNWLETIRLLRGDWNDKAGLGDEGLARQPRSGRQPCQFAVDAPASAVAASRRAAAGGVAEQIERRRVGLAGQPFPHPVPDRGHVRKEAEVPERRALRGEALTYGIAGPMHPRRYGLEPRGEGWAFCDRDANNCWEVAQGQSGPLEGGRAFIDAHRDHLRIAIIRPESEDVIFEGHGVKVLVDPKSLPYIDGTELDFVREGLNEGFKFHNPREKDRCGCGESFRV